MAKRFFGISLIVIALGIAILPQYTTCQHFGNSLALANGKTTPMKCNWTAQAEIAVAAPLAVVGVMVMASRRETVRNLSVMGVVLGVFAVLLPTSLIGTCSSQMPCNLIMKPSLIGMGSIVAVGSLVSTAVNLKSREKDL